jgi:ABC-type transporter MlaC component
VGSGSGTIAATSSAWQLSNVLNIGVTFNTAIAAGAAPVAFRFTPSGASAGNWQIDDVYVDPYARH